MNLGSEVTEPITNTVKRMINNITGTQDVKEYITKVYILDVTSDLKRITYDLASRWNDMDDWSPILMYRIVLELFIINTPKPVPDMPEKVFKDIICNMVKEECVSKDNLPYLSPYMNDLDDIISYIVDDIQLPIKIENKHIIGINYIPMKWVLNNNQLIIHVGAINDD